MTKFDNPTVQDKQTPESRAKQEALSRPERLKFLKNEIKRLFPDPKEGSPSPELIELRSKIERSLDTPQLGKFHNEGMFMDTHIAKMLQTVDDLVSGNFPSEAMEQIPEDTRQAIQQLAVDNADDLKRYALLHDVGKPDCMTLKRHEGDDEIITWEQWEANIPEDIRNNPVELQKYLRENGYRSISYQQSGDKAAGESTRLHGAIGAEQIETLDIPKHLLELIRKHDEIVTKFDLVDAGGGKKQSEFKRLPIEQVPNLEAAIDETGLGEEGFAWILAISYLDFNASIRSDGGVDFSGVTHIIDAVHNYNAIKLVQSELQPDGKKAIDGIDNRRLNNLLRQLNSLDRRIKVSAAELLEQTRYECRIREYSPDLLRPALEQAFTSSPDALTKIDIIISGIDADGKLNMKVLGRVQAELGRMGNDVYEAYEQALEQAVSN